MMILILPPLRDAVVLIEEAARIEENTTVNGPTLYPVYQKIQAKTSSKNILLKQITGRLNL